MIPYGKHYIDDEDIQCVVDVLKSDWLTTGPAVVTFEKEMASFVNASDAIAVSNGTAALHCAMYAIDVRPGDEVIVPAMTFVATANCIRYLGGKPIFADVEADTMLIDPADVVKKITKQTKAIIAVDYAGHPCDYHALRSICNKYNLKLISDACHALGATYHGEYVGGLADLTVFSFHPVKHITTGEGGMVVTNRKDWVKRIRRFRNHGIDGDFRQREKKGSWYYEMVDLGYNYRISDIQCALGLSQLKKLPEFLMTRRKIAEHYRIAFQGSNNITPLSELSDVQHAYHLFVVKITGNRKIVYKKMRDLGVAVNVHYIPVHYHPYYRKMQDNRLGMCPVAERNYEKLLSLPIFPNMQQNQIEKVVDAINKCVE